MKFNELINADNILNFLLIVMFLALIYTVVLRKTNKAAKDEEKRLIKEKYPHLSDKDMKYRETCINQYIRIYSDSYAKQYKFFSFFSLMIFLTFGALFVYLASANPLGSNFCLSLLLLFISGVALSRPNYEVQQNFWKDYLEKHPDNPLMVVLSSPEKSKKSIKSAKILGFYFLICGLFSLIATCLVFFQFIG